MSATLTFGIRDLPRPRGEGFLYFRYESSRSMRTLVRFNLDASGDEDYIRPVFREGVKRFLQGENLVGRSAVEAIGSYELENMREWSRKVFAEEVDAVLEEVSAGQ